MADTNLQNQFFTALRASKSFSLLKPDEQEKLLQAFANATDEQLNAGLAELTLDAARQQQAELEELQRNKDLAVKVQELKKTLKEVETEERKENEAADVEESGKEADKLLAALSGAEEKPERKKFLGIF